MSKECSWDWGLLTLLRPEERNQDQRGIKKEKKETLGMDQGEKERKDDVNGEDCPGTNLGDHFWSRREGSVIRLIGDIEHGECEVRKKSKEEGNRKCGRGKEEKISWETKWGIFRREKVYGNYANKKLGGGPPFITTLSFCYINSLSLFLSALIHELNKMYLKATKVAQTGSVPFWTQTRGTSMTSSSDPPSCP